LPNRLDLERVLPDQRSGALLQRIFSAALTNARDACVGFDGHDHVALVEELVEIRRLIDLYASDLYLRKGCFSALRPHQRGGGSYREGLQE
jgi:hypothetical protein